MAVNDHLRKLATKVDILDGGATLCFLPFITPYAQNTAQSIQDALGEEGAGETHKSVFVLLESYVMDMAFTPSSSAFVSALRLWWEARSEPVKDRYTIFHTCIPFDLIKVLMGAYYESRQTLPQPSEALMEGPPQVVNDPLPEHGTADGGTQ